MSQTNTISLEDCWLYAGYCNKDDYGAINENGRRRHLAHRVMYENLVGPIPTGLVIDHLCRRPRCINPKHLEAVTNRENLIRGISWNGSKTHCPFGHEYKDDNIILRHHGWRDPRKSYDWSKTFLGMAQAGRRQINYSM